MYVAPEKHKPAEPGLQMAPDGYLSLYHIVEKDHDFNKAAQEVFDLLKKAQAEYPDCERVLYLDIIGHKGEVKGYDPHFFEFQQEFLQGFLGPFFRALDLPLQPVVNPNEQRNDVPDVLDIGK